MFCGKRLVLALQPLIAASPWPELYAPLPTSSRKAAYARSPSARMFRANAWCETLSLRHHGIALNVKDDTARWSTRLSTGGICRKSPPSTVVLPPKGKCRQPMMSRSNSSTALMAAFGAVGASSQIMSCASWRRCALTEENFTLQDTPSKGNGTGNLNSECAVRPPSSKRAAMPDLKHV